MSVPQGKNRTLQMQNRFSPARFFGSWEMVLVYLLLAINAALMLLRPDLYFSAGTVQSIIKSGMDLSFMVLGMTFVLLLGEIDISVGAVMIVSCTATGLLYQSGLPDAAAVLGGLAAGTLCGLFNGVMVAVCGMPSVIVTIATSLLFRGIVQIALDVNTLKVFPEWFSALAWQDLGGVIPYSLICFLVLAVVFGLIAHFTRFGRELYLIGNNAVTAEYSGIRVRRVRLIVFTLMGFCAALSGILFAGRLGGVSSGMGTGYELQVIAIAVLGGVSTKGGRGRMIGPVIAVVIMAFLNKTLDLLGVVSNTRRIITGAILIVAVVIPWISGLLSGRHVRNPAERRS